MRRLVFYYLTTKKTDMWETFAFKMEIFSSKRRRRRRSLEKKINYIKIPLRGTKLPIISL